MAKLTKDSLIKLRNEKKKELQEINESNRIQVIVNLGTCGVAAGAEVALNAFKDETRKLNLNDVIFKTTGCIGYCSHEPTVRIVVPGMPEVIYGYVTDEIARKIVDRHLINKRLLNDHVLDQPSVDIIK